VVVMLRGLEGGVLPPPPQARSNPDSKKLDTRPRAVNFTAFSHEVQGSSLPYSMFFGNSGARAACDWMTFAEGIILNNAPAEYGRSFPFATSRNTLCLSHCDLQEYFFLKSCEGFRNGSFTVKLKRK
jgi:hypothetical protein